MTLREQVRDAMTYPNAAERIEAMIADAVAGEREECRRIAKGFHNQECAYFSDQNGLHNMTAIDIAESIRKRGIP